MALVKRDIGELLVDNGQISPDELKRAEEEKAKSGEPISAVIFRLGFADESQLKNALELEYGVNYVSLKKTALNPELLMAAGEDLCREQEAVPVSKDSRRLTLAMVTPTHQAAIDAFKKKFPALQIKPVVCMESELVDFLNKAFGTHASAKENRKAMATTDPPLDSAGSKATTLQPGQKVDEPPKVEIRARSESATARESAAKIPPPAPVRFPSAQAEAPANQMGPVGEKEDMAIVLLANHILSNALSRGCSNIHIEPTDKEVLVHYRKDGVLFAARKLPKALLPPLVIRFQTMAQISTQERALPQDGRLNVQVSGKQLTFRLSIIPRAAGEHLVIWLE